MTTLTILSKEAITRFETPPAFTAEERKHFFTLPQWAEEIASTLQTPASKIGFILQLGYFKATKKFYAKQSFHQEDITFVAKRLSTGTAETLETILCAFTHSLSACWRQSVSAITLK